MAFDMFTPPASRSCKFEQPGDTYKGTIAEIGERIQATDYGTSNPSTWPSGDPIMQSKITLETDERDPQDPRDDGKRGLWVVESGKQGGLLWAIREAVKAAQVDTIKPGGVLQVTFTQTDPESKNPANPRKLYQASYWPPAPGGGMFQNSSGGGQAPATTTENQMNRPTQQQQPQQAQQAGGYAQQGFPVGNQPAPQSDAGALGQFNNQHQQQPAPQGQPSQQAPAQQPAPQVDADTANRIQQLLAMNVDTTSIVNAVGKPDVTAQVVDSYRNAA